MDSLLATYASSDEDEVDLPRQQSPLNPKSDPKASSSSVSTSFFTSLPPPKSSSLFASVPPPKSHNRQNPKIEASAREAPLGDPVSRSGGLFDSQVSKTLENRNLSGDGEDQGLSIDAAGKKPGLFPALPAPTFGDSNSKASLNLPAPKKVVQFKPPVMSLTRDEDDDDEDDEEEKERKRRRELQSSIEAPTVKSFLSSIPAPKNSKAALGALPTSGSGRRSIIDAEVPSLKQQQQQQQDQVSIAVDSGAVAEDSQDGYVDASGSMPTGVDSTTWYHSAESYGDLAGGSHGGYENYGGYGQYESNWIDRSGSNSVQDAPVVPEAMARVIGKRGRNDIPTDIIEVKQDELMKNRPREDQVKTTGIAFGPSYQPVSAAKGKISKLHKRKHQIGALYFDMKQKEPELAERRSRGYLTKAETHAKYGW
ncbi:unnamed protein product [Rhodiola kirilowii]